MRSEMVNPDAGCQVLKAQVVPVMKVKRTSSAAPRDGRK